jgi:hypothetical protein
MSLLLTSTLSPNLVNVGDYYISKKTAPHNYDNMNGRTSIRSEWTQVLNEVNLVTAVPDENTVQLSGFSSARKYTVSTEYFNQWFFKAHMNDEGRITNNPNPKLNFNINEFNEITRVNMLKRKINNMPLSTTLKTILSDKHHQLYVSQGCPHTITFSEYSAYSSQQSSIRRPGDAIFNRNSRFAPPISSSFTREEFESTSGFPAPLGIRDKDFILPSMLLKTVIKLVWEIANWENVLPLDREIIKNTLVEFPEFNFYEQHHYKCHWCNCRLDVNKYSSNYSSCDNYAEICHRDPNQAFTHSNMYWGHGECNRRQGGYSEQERIEDAIRLLESNPEYRERHSKRITIINI